MLKVRIDLYCDGCERVALQMPVTLAAVYDILRPDPSSGWIAVRMWDGGTQHYCLQCADARRTEAAEESSDD